MTALTGRLATSGSLRLGWEPVCLGNQTLAVIVELSWVL